MALALAAPLVAQEAQLHWVEEVKLPAEADGNSPAFWWNGQLHLFTSIGWPLKLSRSGTGANATRASTGSREPGPSEEAPTPPSPATNSLPGSCLSPSNILRLSFG